MSPPAPLALLAGLVLAVGTGAEKAPQREHLSFEIPSVDGGTISTKDLKGRIVVVDVWGTWCAPCRRVIPHLVELQREFGPKGLTVIGISAEMGSDYATVSRRVREFAAELGINYRLGLLEPAVYEELKRLMRFGDDNFTVPTTLVLDRDGSVLARYPGYFFGQEKEIADLVREKVGSPSGAASAK